MPPDDFHKSRRRAMRRDILGGFQCAVCLAVAVYFFACFAPMLGLPGFFGTRTGAIGGALLGAAIGAGVGWERASRWRLGDKTDHPDFHPITPIARANMNRPDRWWTLYPFVMGGTLLLVLAAGCSRVTILMGADAAFFSLIIVSPIFYMLTFVPPLERRRCLQRRLEANRCLRCTYALDGVQDRICPECGHETPGDADVQAPP